MSTRKPYPSEVSDDEWAFVAPYLTWLPEEAGQRHDDLREVYTALRWMVRTAATWRLMPHDLPPWYSVSQQTQRWLAAGCFEAMVDDLRLLLRGIKGRKGQPSAAIFDSRVLQSTPRKWRTCWLRWSQATQGSKGHVAVDTLGHLLTLLVTPANEQDRAQVGKLAQEVQQASGQSVAIAFVDQGYTGDAPAEAAQAHGIRLEVIKCLGRSLPPPGTPL